MDSTGTEKSRTAVGEMPRVTCDLLIGGAWISAASGQRLPVHDPATGDLVGDVAFGGAEDADRALAAASDAFPAWAATAVGERTRILRRAADLIRERRLAIGTTLTREQGKPLADSLKEIDFAARVFDYYADLAQHRVDEWRPTSAPDIRSLVLRQPVGVVVAITPWNYPVDLFSWKVAPALAAGCTVIAKPPRETPLSTAQTVGCLVDAGLPPGVLNYVVGPDDSVAETLVADPRSRMVALTGSTQTGRRVMELAARHIKRLNLELGGHSPMIVLDDADLDLAVPAAVRRSFSNMGQICIAVNRLFVANHIADDFAERFTHLTSALRLGHGLDAEAEYGPLTTAAQVARTRAHVDDAVSRGARLLWGGTKPSGREFERGHFFLPTVLADVSDDARVMQEETFGPVAPIARFDSIDEVIARANATEYGLAAYVFGRNLDLALRVAERLEYGGVGINVNDVTELEAPFGGWKESGLGRELGPEGLEAYLEPKHIRIRLGST